MDVFPEAWRPSCQCQVSAEAVVGGGVLAQGCWVPAKPELWQSEVNLKMRIVAGSPGQVEDEELLTHPHSFSLPASHPGPNPYLACPDLLAFFAFL